MNASDDLISRQGLLRTLNKYRIEKLLEGKDISLVWECIDKVLQEPSAQPEPERKTGKWIDMGDFEQCSACTGTRLKEVNTVYGKAIWIKSAYCPSCGARMEHEGE